MNTARPITADGRYCLPKCLKSPIKLAADFIRRRVMMSLRDLSSNRRSMAYELFLGLDYLKVVSPDFGCVISACFQSDLIIVHTQ